jgi:NADH-quinone oxidoreductase subunit A
MSELLLDYLPLVVFIAVAIGIGLALLVVPFIVAYKNPDPEKPYEIAPKASSDSFQEQDRGLAQRTMRGKVRA